MNALTRRPCRVAASLVVLLLAAAAPAAVDVGKLTEQPDAWFTSDEGRRVLDGIVAWQLPGGGWNKAYDPLKEPPAKQRVPTPEEEARNPTLHPDDRGGAWHVGTIDNKATYSEMRALARGYRLTQEPRYRAAFDRGLKFLLAAQYPNGGWPQRFPLESGYGRQITFNDNAMAGVLGLLKDLADAKPDFAWAGDDDRRRAREAFARGIDCVLATQIRVDGKLTGWCQQHDAVTLAPTSARSYELPAITGSETAEIVMLLMRIDDPSPAVREAIRSAVAWLEASKITGKRLEKVADPARPGKTDTVLVDDPAGETLWARFYDIETNRPFYSGRDGVKKWSLAEIEPERRAGYAWLRPFGAKVLKAYPQWEAKHGGAAAAR